MPTIFGTFDPDSLLGGDEADEIFAWPTRNKSVDGNWDDDTLDGAAGDDTIDGGGGVDVLIGGLGNDVIIDHNDDAVRVVQRFDISGGDGDDAIVLRSEYRASDGVEGVIDGGDGHDTLEMYDLGTLAGLDVRGIETLLLRGTISATAEQFESFDEIRLRGDVSGISLAAPGSVDLSGKLFGGGDRIEIYGTEGEDRIEADSRDGVWLHGYGGDDTLIGGNGDDIFEDSRGNSVISAGGGGDLIEIFGGTARIRAGEGDDVISLFDLRSGLLAGDGGYDIVDLSSEFTDLTDVELRGIEELRVRGEVIINPHDLDGIDRIRADGTPFPSIRLDSAGRFSLDERFLGVDTVTGSAGDDRLGGSTTYEALFGAAGDDTLDGGDFKDLLNGGDGVDTVVYRSSDEAVSIYLSGGSGYGGTAEGDTLAKIENVVGSSYADWLEGSRAANMLEGGRGSDTLDGGRGADELIGGKGDDVYYVDDAGDKVVELGDGGSDIIISKVDYSLVGANVESLQLFGNKRADALGNDLDNTITGNGASNVIDGGLGNDKLGGGAGRDAFVFSTELTPENVDQILDFSYLYDTVRLHAEVFTGLVSGKLAKSAFVVGAAATDDGHRIIYDAASEALLFDRDGSGAAFEAVQFATLNAGLTLSHEDFRIV